MTYYLAIPAMIVNTACAALALHAKDTDTFLIGWGGATLTFGGWLHYAQKAAPEGETPMDYRGLAMRLRWEWKEENIRRGTRLPNITAIAQRHGTTRSTVSRALKMLTAEGLIETIPGWGIYLTDTNGNPVPHDDSPRSRVETFLLALAANTNSGDPMPNTRDLTRTLNTSPSTVRRAQTTLIRRGIIRRTKNGYVRA